MKVLSASMDSLAISKPPMLALLSNGGNSSAPSWNVTGTGYDAGTTLIDVLTCNKFSTDGNGNLAAHSKDGLPLVSSPCIIFNNCRLTRYQVLLPESSMNTSSLCGYKNTVTTSAAPRNAGLSFSLTISVAAIFALITIL